MHKHCKNYPNSKIIEHDYILPKIGMGRSEEHLRETN